MVFTFDKKTYFFKAKTEFFTKNAFFRVLSKALFDHQNIEKITFCLFENAPHSCIQLETGAQRCFVVVHIPGNPNKPLEMPFEVGLGEFRMFFLKITENSHFRPFWVIFRPFWAIFGLKLKFFNRKKSFFYSKMEITPCGGRLKKI